MVLRARGTVPRDDDGVDKGVENGVDSLERGVDGSSSEGLGADDPNAGGRVRLLRVIRSGEET